MAIEHVKVVVMVTLMLAPLSIQAQEVPARTDRNGLLQDARVYSQDYGVSLFEAMRRLRLQDWIGELEARLAAERPESFAGLWIEHGESLRVVVRFTDPVDVRQVGRFVAGTGLRPIVEARAAEFSLRRLEEDQALVMSAMSAGGIEVDSAIDVQSNRVEVYVPEDGEGRKSQVRSVPIPRSARIVEVPALASPANYPANPFYGGLSLGTCSTGYAVFKPQAGGTTQTGMTTAGHCANSLSYSGKSLTFLGELCNNGRDIQWHYESTLWERPWIKVQSGIREIYGQKLRANQVVGEYVCKSGISTGYQCGNITTKSYQPTWSACAPHTATYIRVAGTSSLSQSGDSGGPVFSGNTAYGLVSGNQLNSQGTFFDLIYMPIDKLADLGLTLWTGTPPSQQCLDDCWYQWDACKLQYCYYDYSAYWCHTGCDEYYQICQLEC